MPSPSAIRAERWLNGLSTSSDAFEDARAFSSLLRADSPLDSNLYNALIAVTMAFRGAEVEEPPLWKKMVDSEGPTQSFEHSIYLRLVLSYNGEGRPPSGIREKLLEQDFFSALALPRPQLDAGLLIAVAARRAFNRRSFSELVRHRIQFDHELRRTIADAIDKVESSDFYLKLERRAKRNRGQPRHSDFKSACLEQVAKDRVVFKIAGPQGRNRYDKQDMPKAMQDLERGERTIRSRIKRAQSSPSKSKR